MALKFCFCVFWKGPTFPALLQFSLNTTVIGLISYLRPGSGSEEGRCGGRGGRGDPGPTAGSRHASVAAVAELHPRHQLLFSHLKAVYEADPGRPSVGGNWDESKGKRGEKEKSHIIAFNHTTPQPLSTPHNVHHFCHLRPFPEISYFLLCTSIKPLHKRDLTP